MGSGDLDTTANTSSGSDSEDSTDNDSNDDTDSNDEEDVDSDEEDECEGLIESDCNDTTDDEGDAECAYNVVSGDCYSIERREGRFGSGNFDDGFIAAKEEANQQTSGLYAVIGVLGGVVGIMLIVIVFGGYYLYNKTNKGQAAQIADESGHKHHFTEDDDAHLMENTQETR